MSTTRLGFIFSSADPTGVRFVCDDGTRASHLLNAAGAAIELAGEQLAGETCDCPTCPHNRNTHRALAHVMARLRTVPRNAAHH